MIFFQDVLWGCYANETAKIPKVGMLIDLRVQYLVRLLDFHGESHMVILRTPILS